MARLPGELVAKGSYRPEAIGELAASCLERYQRDQQRSDPILTQWEQMLPPGLAGHCRVTGVQGRTLSVSVDSPAYLYEMQLCRVDLLRALQAACPQAHLQDIRLRLR